jgi:hypothetical protein
MPQIAQPRRARSLPGAILLAVLVVAAPTAAFAYVGPGLGLGAIASFFALIGAILMGIVGFVWYPFKRLLRAMRQRNAQDD